MLLTTKWPLINYSIANKTSKEVLKHLKMFLQSFTISIKKLQNLRNQVGPLEKNEHDQIKIT